MRKILLVVLILSFPLSVTYAQGSLTNEDLVVLQQILNEGKDTALEGQLFAEWKSNYTDNLRQQILNDNGQIKSKQFITMRYQEEVGSDCLKAKFLNKIEVFNDKGVQLPETSYTPYQLYIPKTSMKK